MNPSHQENAQGTTRYLHEQVGRLFDSLPGARRSEEEPIHQIRVASRRLRVVLPVVARKPAGRRVRRALGRLRALTRLAGKGRDFDVCMALFEQKAPRMKNRPMVVSALRERLQAARKQAHRALAKDLADFDATRLREDLDILVERGGEGMEEARFRLGNAIVVEERILLKERRALGRRFAPPELHAIRRRCRWLRYARELEHALFAGDARPVKVFKDIQDLLGRLHDASMLAEWIARQAGVWESEGKQARATAARALGGRFQDHARSLHRRFLRHRPATWMRSMAKA